MPSPSSGRHGDRASTGATVPRRSPDGDGASEAGSTRQRLLDAARPLFVRNGLKASSIREIAAAAGVNSALITYHFGGKEGLFVEVYKAAADPVNRERMRLFDEIEAGGGTLTVDGVLSAWIRPMLGGDDARRGVVVADLALAINAPTDELYHRLTSETYDAVNVRFLSLLQRCLPGVPRSTLIWRLNFLIAAVLTAARDRRLAVQGLTDDRSRSNEGDRVLRELAAFAAAGFAAPPASDRAIEPRRRAPKIAKFLRV